jgi:hypothetical protein
MVSGILEKHRVKRINDGMKNNSDQLPEKLPYPTRTGDAVFRELERCIEIDRAHVWIEAKREVKAQALRKLELLDELHQDLIRKAQHVVSKAQHDISLHEITINAAKIRGKIYHLYERDTGPNLFFSILEPSEYALADPEARYRGAFRLNEDSSWSEMSCPSDGQDLS